MVDTWEKRHFVAGTLKKQKRNICHYVCPTVCLSVALGYQELCYWIFNFSVISIFFQTAQTIWLRIRPIRGCTKMLGKYLKNGVFQSSWNQWLFFLLECSHLSSTIRAQWVTKGFSGVSIGVQKVELNPSKGSQCRLITIWKDSTIYELYTASPFFLLFWAPKTVTASDSNNESFQFQ